MPATTTCRSSNSDYSDVKKTRRAECCTSGDAALKQGPGCRRYMLAWLLCAGLMLSLAQRTELGIAVIKMTERVSIDLPTFQMVPTKQSQTQTDVKSESSSSHNQGTLPKTHLSMHRVTSFKRVSARRIPWNHEMVAVIESAFFIGYMLFSIPGGLLTTLYSSTKVFGVATGIAASLNLLLPSLVELGAWRRAAMATDAANSHSISNNTVLGGSSDSNSVISDAGFALVLLVRIVQGAAEGCLYPCVHGIWRFWAPQLERSKLVSISFFGMAIGPIIGYPVSGQLTEALGWQVPFYFWGAATLVWLLVWVTLARSRPGFDPYISQEEREYIESSLQQQSGGEDKNNEIKGGVRGVPWMAMLTSLPVWAIVMANVGRNWTFQFAFTGMPSFFKHEFQAGELANGISMGVPFIVMAIATLIGGHLADCLIVKRMLSVRNTRRLLNSLGFGLTGLALLVMGFMPSLVLAVTALSIGMGGSGLGMSGYGLNHLDIAAKYSGILMGISNGLGTLSGILSPIINSAMVPTNTHTQWLNFLILSTVIHLVTALFFAVFVSGEEQSWANGGKSKSETTPTPTKDDIKDKEKQKQQEKKQKTPLMELKAIDATAPPNHPPPEYGATSTTRSNE